MNTNIVDYIIENKKLNQTSIAKKMLNPDPKKQGISQVAVSKWKRGGDIPKEREIELLKMADIYWRIGTEVKESEEPWELDEEIEVIDSRWNVFVQSEKNQEDWYDFIIEILSPRKFLDISREYNYSKSLGFIRNCILLLNDVGFDIPSNPQLIKASPNNDSYNFEEGTLYFELLFKWINRINSLQNWCFETLPRGGGDLSIRYREAYDNLPRVALAQVLHELPHLPVGHDFKKLEVLVNETKQWVNKTIDEWLFWAGMADIPFQFNEDNFDEILIKSNVDNASVKTKPTLTSEADASEYAYWSEAERKIYEGIKNNEKLLKELLEKLNKQEKE